MVSPRTKAVARARQNRLAGRPSPQLLVAVGREPDAPVAPSRRVLSLVLRRTLALLPRSRAAAAKLPERVAVDVHIVGDGSIAAVNQAHLRERGPTDVLAFPMHERDPERRAHHLGEIVVSFETARREAAARGLPIQEEISRYCVHGFLHLLGYDDQTAKQRRAMFAVQEKALRKAVSD